MQKLAKSLKTDAHFIRLFVSNVVGGAIAYKWGPFTSNSTPYPVAHKKSFKRKGNAHFDKKKLLNQSTCTSLPYITLSLGSIETDRVISETML